MNQQASFGNEVKGFGRLDYVKISILGFALTALWGSLHSIILPLRLIDFVAESQKNTYLGLLTFTGLVITMAVQPIVGAISDRSRFRWGRRRPYILLGVLLSVLFLPVIGLAGNFAVIFIFYCLLQISSNTAQGPFQAFIPDLVPGGKRGLASGVKGLFEILGGVAIVRLIAYFMGNYFGAEGGSWLWLALGVLAIVLLGAMIATILMVKERPGAIFIEATLLSSLRNSFKINVKANRNFILFLISRGLMGMPGVMLQIFALYYLMDVIGIVNPAKTAADLLIVVGVCLLVTVYPAGRLSDRIGRKPVIISAGLIGSLGVVALFFSKSYLHVMLSGAILGIANGAVLSSCWALATDLVTKHEEARYLGLTMLAMAGGSALARLIGPVIDFFNNINAGLGYQVMLLVCLICFVVGTLLIIKVRLPSSNQNQ
jgi:MFS family permease